MIMPDAIGLGDLDRVKIDCETATLAKQPISEQHYLWRVSSSEA
jgi:hypothetical protein